MKLRRPSIFKGTCVCFHCEMHHCTIKLFVATAFLACVMAQTTTTAASVTTTTAVLATTTPAPTGGLDAGSIAAITLGSIIGVGILAFIIWKAYGKIVYHDTKTYGKLNDGDDTQRSLLPSRPELTTDGF